MLVTVPHGSADVLAVPRDDDANGLDLVDARVGRVQHAVVPAEAHGTAGPNDRLQLVCQTLGHAWDYRRGNLLVRARL